MRRHGDPLPEELARAQRSLRPNVRARIQLIDPMVEEQVHVAT